MHKIDIPDNIRSRSLGQRGREHVVEHIEPARTAHVIVDLQNGFMGAPFDVPVAREIVPNVNLICATPAGSTCSCATPAIRPSRSPGPSGSRHISARK
jgi:hypothetical protein